MELGKITSSSFYIDFGTLENSALSSCTEAMDESVSPLMLLKYRNASLFFTRKQFFKESTREFLRLGVGGKRKEEWNF